MQSLNTRLQALEKAIPKRDGVDTIIVVRFDTPNEKNVIKALSCDEQVWVRGDDEEEQAFIDRASADVHKQKSGSMVALLLQTDSPQQ